MVVSGGRSSSASKGNGLIVFGALIAFGFGFGGFGYAKLGIAPESAAWPTTEEHVT